jgi:hypothetical protein
MKLNKLNIAIVGLSGMLSAPAFAQNFYQCMPVGCQKGEYGKPGFCNPCEQGTYSDTINATACKKCPPGSYNTGGGSSMCEFCPAGQYQENYGGGCCDYCKSGTYSLQGATKCYTNREYVGFGGGSADGTYSVGEDYVALSIKVGGDTKRFSPNEYLNGNLEYGSWHLYDAKCSEKTEGMSWENQSILNLSASKTFKNPFATNCDSEEANCRKFKPIYVKAEKTAKGVKIYFANEENCKVANASSSTSINCSKYESDTALAYKDYYTYNSGAVTCLQCEISNSYIVDDMEVSCE